MSPNVDSRDAEAMEAVLFYGSGSAKNLPLPHRLFDLKSN